jgi:hypothetical protein
MWPMPGRREEAAFGLDGGRLRAPSVSGLLPDREWPKRPPRRDFGSCYGRGRSAAQVFAPQHLMLSGVPSSEPTPRGRHAQAVEMPPGAPST